MASSERIDTGLPETSLVMDWLNRTQETTSEQNRAVGRWFKQVVTAWGKQTAYAEMIGVPVQHLTEMFAGTRVIYLRHVLPALSEWAAALVLVQPFLSAHDYMAMPKPQMSRRRAIETIAAVIKRNPTLRRAAREEIRDAGLDPDDVEQASEFGAEQTQPGVSEAK